MVLFCALSISRGSPNSASLPGIPGGESGGKSGDSEGRIRGDKNSLEVRELLLSASPRQAAVGLTARGQVLLGLDSRQAAVDRKVDAGDVAALIRGEE